MSTIKKVVLAYSGGLDTSIIIPWIKEHYDGAEIIAYCSDCGQGEELDGLEEKALSTGASKCYIDDQKEEFARDFIFSMFQATSSRALGTPLRLLRHATGVTN